MDTLGGWMQEIRYFYRRQASYPLSVHAQALWAYLMYRGNENFWHFPIRLSVYELAGATKMSATMVKRAREELERQGYLLHEVYGGNKPAGYYMLSCLRPGTPMAPKPLKMPEQTEPALSGAGPPVH